MKSIQAELNVKTLWKSFHVISRLQKAWPGKPSATLDWKLVEPINGQESAGRALLRGGAHRGHFKWKDWFWDKLSICRVPRTAVDYLFSTTFVPSLFHEPCPTLYLAPVLTTWKKPGSWLPLQWNGSILIGQLVEASKIPYQTNSNYEHSVHITLFQGSHYGNFLTERILGSERYLKDALAEDVVDAEGASGVEDAALGAAAAAAAVVGAVLLAAAFHFQLLFGGPR